MAPVVAELLWGTTPISRIGTLLLQIPIYGGGVLFIRDLVRHRGRGWLSILLFGAAYALVEEGLALQFLFHPTLFGISDWGARVVGINGVYTQWAMGYHAIWSVALPILLTDLLFPKFRDTPYLGRVGVTGAFLVYLLGIVVLGFIARVGITPGYWASPMLLGLTVLVVLLLAWVALWVLPPVSPGSHSASARPAPSPWIVLVVGLVAGFLWQFILALSRVFFPVLIQGALVLLPMLVAASLAAGVFWLLRRWSQSQDWNDMHWLALASGALVAHTVFGVLFLTFTPLDKVGLAVLGVLMVALLILFAMRLGRRERIDANMESATP
jgi:hypothetical protein